MFLHFKRILFYTLCLGFLSFPIYAQEAALNQHTIHLQERAEEQFAHNNYILAAQSARAVLKENNPFQMNETWVNSQERAAYILASSLLKLNFPYAHDSATHLSQFIFNTVFQHRLDLARAQNYFVNQNYEKAITYYEKAGIKNIPNTEIADAKFELGYCYFLNKKNEAALPLFTYSKEVTNSKYFKASNYYYGLLLFNNGRYSDALQSFNKIEDDDSYASTVPYFKSEIYYFSDEKDKALDYVLKELKSKKNSFYEKELHLLAAQCYYEKQQYTEALPHFEYYYNHSDKIKKEDLYEIGYSYYANKNYENAIESFKPLVNTDDSLAQSAMYYLGDCFLKTNDKKSARNALGLCIEKKFLMTTRENALLTYAKLSEELGYNNEAIESLSVLLKDYKKSNYTVEAKSLLSHLYAKTNNYETAYETMNSIQSEDSNFRKLYQHICYGFGLKEIKNNNLTNADSLLNQSLKYPIVKSEANSAHFWIGEIANRTQQYEHSTIELKTFIDNQEKELTSNDKRDLAEAYFTLGCNQMELHHFEEAKNYFKQVENTTADKTLLEQAITREADATLMMNDLKGAGDIYDKIAAKNGIDADYARIQKANLAGIKGHNGEKIAILQSLVNQKPTSPYANEAAYEWALTLMEQEKYTNAIKLLDPLTNADIGKTLTPKAIFKTGLCYQMMNKNENAILNFKKIIIEYPATEERNEAIQNLKSIYLEENRPELLTEFLSSRGLNTTNTNDMDSAFYTAAEIQFSQNNYLQAISSFGRYMQQFPMGVFSVPAHYYRAESFLKLKQSDSALNEYDAVLKLPWSVFTEKSAQQAATINYSEKNYKEAAIYYQFLHLKNTDPAKLSLIFEGLMNCASAQNEVTLAAKYADSLLLIPDLSSNLKDAALLQKAKIALSTNDYDNARTALQPLSQSTDGLIAAESRYHLIEILLAEKKYKEAETEANLAIQYSAGYEYWVAKTYFLLSDALVGQKDFFNAKALLVSMKRNLKNEDLRTLANDKITELKKIEKLSSKLNDK